MILSNNFGNLQKDSHKLVELGSFFLKEPFWLSQVYKALLVTHTSYSILRAAKQSSQHNALVWQQKSLIFVLVCGFGAVVSSLQQGPLLLSW